MKLALSILAILMLCSVAGAQTAELVKAELVADTQAIEAGKLFQVALHLTIADGWHVYWTNPGDAGAPTTLKLTLPKGFTSGPVQYPVPEKVPQPGNLTVYAYEHELLLTETVTPPVDLKVGSTIPISVTTGWCVCNPDKCVLGKKTLSMELTVGRQIQPDHAELFAAWATRMPADEGNLFHDVSVLVGDSSVGSWSPARRELSFNWESDPPAANFQWLPGPCDDLTVRELESHTNGHTTTVILLIDKIQGIPLSRSTIQGILAYHVQGQARGVAVSFNRHSLDVPQPTGPASAK